MAIFHMKKLIFSGFCCIILQYCRAQVPVSQEPMHHKILDNGHVRLLDVHIQPGDTTQYHIHSTPSVFLLLTTANTGSQVVSEEDRSGSPIPHYGEIWFEGFYVKPRIHRVYNHDTHEYRVMDIELTSKKFIPIDSPIKQEAFTFLFEEKPVRAYRLLLRPAGNISIQTRKADILVIQLTDSVNDFRVNEKSFHLKGDWLYIPAGFPIKIKNGGLVKAEFAFFELK
jgi:hypothetical protein